MIASRQKPSVAAKKPAAVIVHCTSGTRPEDIDCPPPLRSSGAHGGADLADEDFELVLEVGQPGRRAGVVAGAGDECSAASHQREQTVMPTWLVASISVACSIAHSVVFAARPPAAAPLSMKKRLEAAHAFGIDDGDEVVG